ncbi:MAG: nucleotide exchange factor GrpE [Eubacteriales bacterium]|nr:nucleotide exchange factor GrpE [Eubacteriales bacterium]
MEENKKEFDESIVEETAEAAEAVSEEAVEEIASEEVAVEETEEALEADAEEAAKDKKAKKKKKSTKTLEIALEKSEAKVAELTDRYQRLMAEFENARKRNAKEQSLRYDMGAKDVLGKLLPVIDNFERGIDTLTEEEKEGAFAQGIVKIYEQLMTTFTELGVTPMDAKGKEFNPDFHNAVMHAEDPEQGENLVSDEFQKGYMYKDSVLRHAMVKVVN